MTEREARQEARENNDMRKASMCPTTREYCTFRCICYKASEALPPTEHIRETWEVSPTICTHKDHPIPECPFDSMACTFPPHKVVKEK